MRTPQVPARIGAAVVAGTLVTALVGCGERGESVPADDQCQLVERVEDRPVDCPEE